MDTRAELLDSFVAELSPVGVLDRFRLAGVVASWWGSVQYDIRTLSYHQFSGVVQGWLTTIQTAFAEDGPAAVADKQRQAAAKRKARDHPIVPGLIPDYLNELDKAEARRAELDAQLKAATAVASEDEEEEPEEAISEADLKKLKSDLAAAKKRGRGLEADFVQRLSWAVLALQNEGTETVLVLRILKSDLLGRLQARIATGRRTLVDRYGTWADKYAITLRHLEAQHEAAAARLDAQLKELGYE
jgi:type I restriction enzyme M protein